MIVPDKLKAGDKVAIIAPSESMLTNFTPEVKMHAEAILQQLGLQMKFGKYIEDDDLFGSASVAKRLEDFHNAWSDPEVKAVIPVSGGTTSNNLLPLLNYDLIRNNPKIYCGLSDQTSVQMALYTQANLMSYYGPHYSVFAASNSDDLNIDYFRKCLFADSPFQLFSNDKFIDSEWNRKEHKNSGYWIINDGEAEGELIGGNLLTLNFIQGSKYFPSLADKILFLEDNSKISDQGFFNQLHGLMYQDGFSSIRGLMIGRFQPESDVKRETLVKALRTIEALKKIPVIANVDFGHTLPMVTLPIGGKARIRRKDKATEIVIAEH